MTPPHAAARTHEPAGLAAREAAVGLLQAVLVRRQPLDEALVRSPAAKRMAGLEGRDRAFARAIAATSLRRKGQIEAVLAQFLAKGMPQKAGALPQILLAAACQLLFLGTPPHAVVGIAVGQCQRDPQARRYDKLANAVLRRVGAEGPALVAAQDAARLDTPDWLWARWSEAFGEADVRAIAEAHLGEPPLDLTVKSDPEGWARRLGGVVLPTGSVRLDARGPIEQLDGFAEGAWWVQDVAAALPARLMGDVRGARVADLCAAPGGKTAQLAQAGAQVTAVDLSQTRLARVQDNLDRLKLSADLVVADAAAWRPDAPFDAVLLDAPCTATGTIRRHPDIPLLKSQTDVTELAALQARLLDHAVSLVRPGGALVYCTCSLEREEGEGQIEGLLKRKPDLRRDAIRPEEVAGRADWLTGEGALRTLPFYSPGGEAQGMDGFFAARILV